MNFEIGNLYKRLSGCFPREYKSDTIYISLSEDILNLEPGDVIMVLEKHYIRRSKLHSVQGENKTRRYNQWHLKILKDDKIGYAELWEDEWINM